jgi:hypothetical protein
MPSPVVEASTAHRCLPSAQEGATGGLVGAVSVAFWFLVTDTLTGHPFQTPALLGARFFRGASAEQLAACPDSAFTLVAGYTLVHVLSFVIAGLLIAGAIELFERTPPLLIPGFFFLVVFFEFVYYTYVLAFVEPIFGAVPWPAVLLGNLVAVASMIAYFWRRHSELPGRLLRG